MNKLQAIISERTERRRKLAEVAAGRALAALRGQGVDIRIFGSLARGDFRAHSDVDFLVYGAVDQVVRVAVEVEVADAMRDSELPFDVFYLDDMTAEQAAAFANV